MRPPPSLRPLFLAYAADLAAEARRTGVSLEDLARLVGPIEIFALGGLTPAEAVMVARDAPARGIAALPAPRGSERDEGETRPSERNEGRASASCYLAGTPDAVVDLVRSLPAPLRDAAPFFDSCRPSDGPARTLRIQGRSLPFDRLPLVMGILNVTPDSFSDGGAYSTLETAVRRAGEMVEQGADIIDIGGESTRPGSDPVPAAIEKDRVLPVIERLGAGFPVPISIDTHKGPVASAALAAGASIVNDVTGLRADPTVAEIAARAGAALIVSHIRGTPKTMHAGPHYDDLMREVTGELLESARCAARAGVFRESIVIDPGIGFGKTFEHNAELLRRLPELAGLGLPVLVGASRKSFLGAILGAPPERRLEGSLAAAALARQGGAAIVRVHDVAETRRFFDTLDALAPLETEPRRNA